MTVKQKTAAKNLVGNGGNITKAMRDAGYSEATINTPQKLTESKGFREILEEAGVTDEKLSKVLHEGLDAKKEVILKDGTKIGDEPDYSVRHKYLETAIKVKGHIADAPTGNTYNTVIQQNNGIDSSSKEAKDVIDITLQTLMEQTKGGPRPTSSEGNSSG